MDRGKKIGELELRNDEWDRVKLFLDLLTVCILISHRLALFTSYLQHADHAQQAFSSNRNPSLHLAIPALEALHKAWSARLARLKYGHFKKPLQAAIDKIAAYYKKTGGADAYIIAMCEL